jgi:environmental stress-induced protein Ves
MKLTHLTADDFDIKPWRNGLGTTADLYMTPAGANHDDFELRFSMAPIVEDGAFSSFPSADRRITLIEGEALELDFGDFVHRLTPLAPFGFDTELAPIGRPINGPVRVVNVMARRPRWKIEDVQVVNKASLSLAETNFAFLFAISGEWQATGDDKPLTLQSHEVLLMEGSGTIQIAPLDQGQAILARLSPTD